MFSLKQEVKMLDMIRVVEVLNEVKLDRDCDKLVPICIINVENLIVGYEIGMQEESLRTVKELNITGDLYNQLLTPYVVLDLVCNDMIDALLKEILCKGDERNSFVKVL